MLRIAVLCSGGGTNLQSLIDADKAGALGAEISLVIASKPDIYALQRATDNDYPAVVLPRGERGEIAGILNKNRIDLAVCAGWLVILDRDFFTEFNGDTINIHPALLPKYGGLGFYGIRVHEAVLAAGEKVSGATVHYVTEQVDAGPIILQKTVPVYAHDTPETLQERVMTAEREILPNAVKLYSMNKLSVQR